MCYYWENWNYSLGNHSLYAFNIIFPMVVCCPRFSGERNSDV